MPPVFRRLSFFAVLLCLASAPGYAATKSTAEDFKKLTAMDFASVERLANGGATNAKLELATRYAVGKDVAKDERKAIELIKGLADEDSQAMYLMGAAYASGLGVEKDDAQAVAWFRRSAERGNVNGQYWLANMLVTGRAGGPSDPKAARPWLERAAEQGDAGSRYALAIIIGNGQAGNPPDWAKAIPLLKKAAGQRDSAAAMVLGMLYADGKGVKQNNNEAAKWYRRSIAIDFNAQSQFNLTRLIDQKFVKRRPGDPEFRIAPEDLGMGVSVTGKN